MTGERTSGDILGSLARAEQLRRRRFVTRHLLRVVPATAGVLLVTAAIVRLVGAPVSIFWAVFAIAVAGVAVFAWIAGRVPPLTDAAALQLDTDAGLQGELRSAHWFAANPVSNPWTSFHLDRATGHIDSVSWSSVYPPVKAARAWAGSALLATAAIAVVLTSAWPMAKGNTPAVNAKDAKKIAGEPESGIPADLQKQIDELLRKIQSGAMPMDEAREKVAELRDKLAGLDPKMQAALAKAAGEQKPSTEKSDAKSLADRAKEAAAKPFLPQDMKWSMEDLASKLKYAGKPTEKASEEDQKGQEMSKGAGEKSDAAPKAGDAGSQMTRMSAADAQSTQMMAATMAPMGGERGPNTDPKKGTVGQPLDMRADLRKETIEADEDTEGTNVLNEIRKKSEKSNAALGFTRVAPLAAYDKSHAAPPPAPSDAVRALLKNYFIRK